MLPVLKGRADLDKDKIQAAIKQLLEAPAALIKQTERVLKLKEDVRDDTWDAIFDIKSSSTRACFQPRKRMPSAASRLFPPPTRNLFVFKCRVS